jgi:hypothetical protein
MSPLSAIPALDSRASAAAKIYLDFNGDTSATWGSYRPGTTPAYDTDGDATTFSDTELANIRDIFNRVAEKYAPFNIDVTTVDPGTYANRVAVHVVIGGSGSWLGSAAGGVAFINAFTNSSSNNAWVFPAMLGNGTPKYVAEAAAHEAGHTFGLQHQSAYDSAGNQTAAYRGNDANGDAPIMGNSYSARRGMWSNGTSALGSTSYQDDLSIISSSANAFGYRADDYGSTPSTAAALSLTGTAVNATAGVIEKTSDADVFSFTTGAGGVSFTAKPSTYGGMLDAKLELRDASGSLVASADSGLSETLTASLAAGTYTIAVESHGGYGDVGQYTLTGNVVASDATPPTPQPTAPAAPGALTAATLTKTSVRLHWTDNASDETGFKVYASRDQQTWTLLGTVGPNVTSVDHTGLRRSQTYYYKVRAFNAVGDSPDSNVATASTVLTAAIADKGDANLDGVVDFDDLVALSQHYNTVGGMTWADGDFTGDGNVDFNDLTFLSQAYNTGTPVSADAVSGADDTDWGTLTPVDQVAAPSGAATVATATTPLSRDPKGSATTGAANGNAARPASVFSATPIRRPAHRA